jgi:hypothetical protein
MSILIFSFFRNLQTELIDKIFYGKTNCTEKEGGRKNRTVKEGHEQSFSHVRVYLGQLIRRPLETNIHSILCFFSWSRNVAANLPPNIQQCKRFRKKHIHDEETEQFGDQTLSIRITCKCECKRSD